MLHDSLPIGGSRGSSGGVNTALRFVNPGNVVYTSAGQISDGVSPPLMNPSRFLALRENVGWGGEILG